MNTSPNLLWLDLETTGLDPIKDVILEISLIITDPRLNILEQGPSLVIHQKDQTLAGISTWAKNQHTQSGLLYEVRSSVVSLGSAEDTCLSFVKKHYRAQTAILAGSSIHFDKEFLRHHMPSLNNYLHYRLIDVSAIKELSLRWYPNLSSFPKIEPHRAKDDIIESINELKYYQANVFVPL